MSSMSPVRLLVPTPADMHAVGRDLARLATGGDLIIVVGELGAGKTQLVQGIGQGLGVHGVVNSPTFVLARVHRGGGDGLGLVHVDTYRMTSRDEVDDLDLEAEMPGAVTVVEWGRGFAEQLNPDRLEVEIERSDDIENETRTVTIIPIGQRWADVLQRWEQIINEDMGCGSRGR